MRNQLLKVKAAKSSYNKQRYKDNKDVIKKKVNQYRVNNLEACKNRAEKWRLENKEKIKKRNKAYRDLPGVKAAEKINKKRYFQIPEVKAKRKKYLKQYQADNKESLKKKQQLYNSLPETKQRRNERRRSNPMHKLNRSIGSQIGRSLKGNKKGAHWEDLTGFTLEQLKKHLEKQFTENMTWNNYGEWHLEHKIPLVVHNFTKSTHTDFKKAWALKNLQPMWKHDNFVKHTKLEHHFQPSLLL